MSLAMLLASNTIQGFSILVPYKIFSLPQRAVQQNLTSQRIKPQARLQQAIVQSIEVPFLAKLKKPLQDGQEFIVLNTLELERDRQYDLPRPTYIQPKEYNYKKYRQVLDGRTNLAKARYAIVYSKIIIGTVNYKGQRLYRRGKQLRLRNQLKADYYPIDEAFNTAVRGRNRQV